MVIMQPSPITIPWNLLIFSKSLMLCLVLENAMKKKKKTRENPFHKFG